MIQWLKCMRRLQQLTSLASHPEGTPDREGKLASQYAHRRRFVSRPACKRAQVIIGDQPQQQQQQQQQQQPQHQRIMNCEFLISSQTAGRHFNSHIDNKCCTSSEPFESNELKFHHAKGNGTHTRKQTNKHTYQISLGDKPSKTPEAGNCPKGCLLDT